MDTSLPSPETQAFANLFIQDKISHEERLGKMRELVAQGADINWEIPAVEQTAFLCYVGWEAVCWTTDIKEGKQPNLDKNRLAQYEETVLLFKQLGANLNVRYGDHPNALRIPIENVIIPHLDCLLRAGVELNSELDMNLQKAGENYYLTSTKHPSSFEPLHTLLQFKQPSTDLSNLLIVMINNPQLKIVPYHSQCMDTLKAFLEKTYLEKQLDSNSNPQPLANISLGNTDKLDKKTIKI